MAIQFDLLHDLVAMLLTAGEREQDVEYRWCQGRECRLICGEARKVSCLLLTTHE